jgi:hypothetical protein
MSLLFIPRMIYKNGAIMEDSDRKKPKNCQKLIPVPHCPPKIPHGLTLVQTWASAVEGRQLIARVMAQLFSGF